MNQWLPFHTETLVSTFSCEEVRSSLTKVTAKVNYLDRREESKKGILFNGLVSDSQFRISKVIDKGDTFLPLLVGEIEATPRGCIIFLKYKLFPGALFFLGFWTLLLIGFSAFFIWVTKDYTYASICLLLGIGNYVVSIFFFQRQVKLSREVFLKLINFQMKD
ncbi:hypothetical protein [Algoriphagus namhaensis]